MEHLRMLWVALSAIMFCASCTNERFAEPEVDVWGSKSIRVTMPPFVNGTGAETRTSFDPSTLALSWSATDTIGIFPEKGDQVNFAMSGGSGNVATFTGGGWALKNNSIYYAYYPFSRVCYAGEHMKNEIPVSMLGQTQTGDNSTAHLGKYACMYSEGTVAGDGKVDLQLHHATAILKLKLTLPVDDDVASVRLSAAGSRFCTQGRLDLQSSGQHVVPDVTAGGIELSCKNLRAVAGVPFTVYMVLPPVDLSGEDVAVTVATANWGKYDCSFRPTKKWEAGKYYTKSLEWGGPPASVLPPNISVVSVKYWDSNTSSFAEMWDDGNGAYSSGIYYAGNRYLLKLRITSGSGTSVEAGFYNSDGSKQAYQVNWTYSDGGEMEGYLETSDFPVVDMVTDAGWCSWSETHLVKAYAANEVGTSECEIRLRQEYDGPMVVPPEEPFLSSAPSISLLSVWLTILSREATKLETGGFHVGLYSTVFVKYHIKSEDSPITDVDFILEGGGSQSMFNNVEWTMSETCMEGYLRVEPIYNRNEHVQIGRDGVGTGYAVLYATNKYGTTKLETQIVYDTIGGNEDAGPIEEF